MQQIYEPMKFSIAFRNLPFEPASSQVIYIENEYSQEINEYIKSNLTSINREYNRQDKEFVYLPSVTSEHDIEQKVRYYAPYLQSDIVYPELPKSSFLLGYMANPENRGKIQPSIIWFDAKEGDDYIFSGRTIESNDDLYCTSDEVRFSEALADDICYRTREDEEIRACEILEDYDDVHKEQECRRKKNTLGNRLRNRLRSSFKKMIADEDDSVCYSQVNFVSEKPPVPSIEPYTDDIDVEDTIRDLERTVARLQLKGITLAAIHEMIDKQEKLSRMVITEDYRIFLPDYGNREIEITPIAKAVYFLFLRYPEGIRIKELPDHHTELFNIYHQLKPNFNEAKMHVTITEITNPFRNRIHEKMSLIRAAFLKQFDEHLAQHYFITGIAGEEYKITLNRNLIEWQEEE